MLFGHNSNVVSGGTTFHVQTEDRGSETALIDTTVFCSGRVLHRRTNNYFDLLPLNADTQEALKLRLDEQHRTVVEDIRSGKLVVAQPPGQPELAAAVPAVTGAPTVAASANLSSTSTLVLELTNPRTWLTGKRATLQISVRQKSTGNPVPGARVVAHVDGSAEPFEFAVDASPLGQALLVFDMPRLAGPDPALVIDASQGTNRGQLRFQLRAKPRVPAAS
jgi:hypothetical protein